MSEFMHGSALSRRTFLSAVGVSAATIAMLTACAPQDAGSAAGGGTMGQTPAEVPSKYAGRRVVVMWHPFGDNRGEAIEKMATDFNESQEDLFVSPQYQASGVLSKATAAVLAKEVPDILAVGHDWRTLYLSKALAPLDDYYGDDFELSGYDQSFLSEGQAEGETYWVPFARSTPLYYYNKTLFQQAGLGDAAPTTWSELREWGGQFAGVKYGDIQSKIYGLSGQDADWQFQGMIRNWGGVDADGWKPKMSGAASVAAGEFTRGFIHDDKQAYMASAIVQDFTTGVCASATMSTASLRGLLNTVDFELGAAFVPGEKENGMIGGGSGLSILAGLSDQRRKDAVKFMSYMAQPTQVAEWSALTGYVVANPKAVEEPAFKEALELSPLFNLASAQMEFVQPYSDMRLWLPNAGGTIFASLQGIWADGKDVKESFTALDGTLQTMIDEFTLRYGEL